MQLVDFTPLEFSSEQTSEDSNLIQGVLLCGNESRNGYKIPSSAFGSEQRVSELYNNTPVYFNHIGPTVRNPMSRNSAEISGVIRNARLVNGRPFGDIEPVDSEQGRLLKSVIRLQPKSYGLSHVARYRMDRGRKTVIAVEEVASVDVVLNPATTNSFQEQTGNMEQVEFYKEQLAEVKATQKAAEEKVTVLTQECEKLRDNVKSLDEANVVLASEKTKLEEELASYRAASERTEKLASLKKQCEEAKVPATAVTELFLESLLTARDEEAVTGLIKERAELFQESKGTTKEPISQPRKSVPASKGWDVNEALKEVKFA